MPLYQWACPQCKHVTAVINSMTDSHVPPEKCQPESIRAIVPGTECDPKPTEQKDSDGKPIYVKHESCGFTGNEETNPENSIYRGWKRLIGSTSFTINGDSAANSYGLYRRW
jgi:hypothetical protein